MARGGARKGAGRPRGKSARIDAEARQKALTGGLTPLDYMLSLLRDAKLSTEDRFEAAKAAAPYVHARLAAVEHSGTVDVRQARDMTDDELAAIATGSGEGAAEPQVVSRLTH